MPLSVGDKIGHYEILSLLGKGGMGEVYRARDTKLKREVALKVLPDGFARDPDRMARFQREAEVLASLNHPNIAAIYGVEERALVMELVEGESPRGPMPFDEAWKIASQITGALECAHDKGIVHRDLKPANIKVTREGVVKLLDFGLAKAFRAESLAPTDPENSPTVTMGATQVGVILGTAAYMSPEQAKGKNVDKRADIWSFGVVLFEMLTGKRMFHGETATEVLASVLKEEPNWSEVPEKVRPLLRRCLEKDPRKRLRDIGEAAAWVESAPETAASQPAAPQSAGRKWLWPGIAALFALAAAAVTFLWIRASSQSPPPLTRFEVALPREMVLSGVPQISPDGQTLAFVAGASGKPGMIYLRPLSETASRVLPGTEGARYSFWSPDGRSLGFTTESREVKRIELAGGAPRTLATANGAFNGTWGRQGDILTYIGGNGEGSPIVRMAASGGLLTPATRLDEKADEKSHRFPYFLPDGKHFLFYVYRSDESHNSVELSTLGSFDRKKVLEGTSAAMYARDSAGQAYLLYKSGETLMAQKFNESAGAVTGEAVAAADNVGGAGNGRWRPEASVSLTGTLVYAAARSSNAFQLTWFDRQGKVIGTVGEPGNYVDLAMSPDGTRAAVAIEANPRSRDIWVLDLDRGISTRLTSDGSLNESPNWSPDGKRILFSSQRNGHYDLFVRAADGTGSEELLLHSDQNKYASDWSRDGRYLAFTSGDPQTKDDLWILPMEGDRKPFVFLSTQFNEQSASFSPDGRWISYASDESGRNEIYVGPFTPPGAASSSTGNSLEGKLRISKDGVTAGGVWRQDGKELIFANSRSVISVDVSTSPSFHAGGPRELLQLPANETVGWDGTRDLKKFLVPVPQQNDAQPPITVVLNWPSAIK
jgi:eukaryotic-like serine/threonine-protein kinase